MREGDILISLVVLCDGTRRGADGVVGSGEGRAWQGRCHRSRRRRRRRRVREKKLANEQNVSEGRRRRLPPPSHTSSGPARQLYAPLRSTTPAYPRSNHIELAQRQESSHPLLRRPPLFRAMASSSNPVDLASLAILSKCTRNACGTSFDPAANTTDACSFHPGVPLFREGLKSWSCCATTKRGAFRLPRQKECS